MADINISVSNDMFCLKLDQCEWTGLKVNEKEVDPINTGNIQFEYKQTDSGSVHFIATANENIDIVNPGQNIFMQNFEGTKSYLLTLSYAKVDGFVTLNGLLQTIPFQVSKDQKSPIKFGQGRMTGTFQLGGSSTPNSSIVHTKWKLSMPQGGENFVTSIKFYTNGKCSYGPYDDCTYTVIGSTFEILVPQLGNSPIAALKFNGAFDENSGQGEMTHVMSGNFKPDGIIYPFTIEKIE
ncbi:hypothetical protein ACNKXS_13520 [Christiangramia marina]|uniref:hypothetical protein n=1 Tax=Christiangramia marina TaxID=409436 RepID=UPI003AA8BC39